MRVYALTWWEGGPPATPPARERSAQVEARSAEAALAELDRLLAADGRQAYAAVARRVPS